MLGGLREKKQYIVNKFYVVKAYQKMPAIPVITETMRVEDIPIQVYKQYTYPPSFEDHIDTLATPVNQGLCGSCWAISTSQCLRDRASRLGPVPNLSFQFIIDCAKNCVTYQGREGCSLDCNGGFLSTSYKFLKEVGTTRYELFPNRHDDNEEGINHIDGVRGVRGACPDAIPDNEPIYKCDSFYNVHIFPDMFGITNARMRPVRRSAQDLKRNADNIAEEIYRNGPVSVCFNLYSDFKDFWLHPNSKNLIYELGWKLPPALRRTIPPVGNVDWTNESNGMYGIYFKTGHSVSIVGYGTMTTAEGPVDYWVCRNSWGLSPNTLHNGYFRIRRGVNCSAIEADVCACTVSSIPTALKPASCAAPSRVAAASPVGGVMGAVLLFLFLAMIMYLAMPKKRALPNYVLQWRR